MAGEFTYETLNYDLSQTVDGTRAERVSAAVFVGEVEKASVLDPRLRAGLNSLGMVSQIPDRSYQSEVEEIVAGMPGGHIASIPIRRQLEFTVNVKMPKLITRSLVTATNIVPTLNTKASPPTMTDATRTYATFSSLTDIKVKSKLVINTRDATKGGFPEVTTVRRIDTDNSRVYFEPLDHVPADGTEAKILNGFSEGASVTDTGIIIPDVVPKSLKNVYLVFVEFITGIDCSVLSYYPDSEITTGNITPDGNQRSMSLTFKPRVQTPKAFKTDWNDDTVTEILPWYGERLIIPSVN